MLFEARSAPVASAADTPAAGARGASAGEALFSSSTEVCSRRFSGDDKGLLVRRRLLPVFAAGASAVAADIEGQRKSPERPSKRRAFILGGEQQGPPTSSAGDSPCIEGSLRLAVSLQAGCSGSAMAAAAAAGLVFVLLLLLMPCRAQF